MMLSRSLLSLSRHSRPIASSASRCFVSSSSLCGKTTTFDLPDPSDANAHRHHLQLTKIVATIGPTSEQAEPMLKVTAAGMSVMRLNFSHATTDEVELRCTNLAAAQQALGQDKNVRAILLDTKGPEIRTGKLASDHSGHETMTLQAGKSITLHSSDVVRDAGSTETDLYIDYFGLSKCLQPGMKVLLDDGAILLTVQATDVSKGTVTCTIHNTGDLRSRAGVNLPLADISDLPSMSEKDRADIKYGMTKDIDFVAASFVQTAQGVREIRAHIEQCAKDLGWSNDVPMPLIISKIETAGSLMHFDEILEESDGIMVARGDLGVEIPLQQVTNAQKEMVAACNAAGKPVIVATQMLESMSKNPRPTRAEVSDVTNAVYDGADCVMLSGETAKGKYPSETITFMNEIILCAERYADSGALGRPATQPFIASPKTPDSAIARAAVASSRERIDTSAILVLADTMALPRLVSSFRPHVPILAFVPSAKLGRQLQLYRGVIPIVGLAGVADHERSNQAMATAKDMGYLKTGSEIVILSMDEDETTGRTATMKIATVH
jgi:pyruvate kinase